MLNWTATISLPLNPHHHPFPASHNKQMERTQFHLIWAKIERAPGCVASQWQATSQTHTQSVFQQGRQAETSGWGRKALKTEFKLVSEWYDTGSPERAQKVLLHVLTAHHLNQTPSVHCSN
jgi:hypothetical protein